MTEEAKHNPGSFCYFELATTDTVAARKFYSTLFGWQYREHPMPDGEHYYSMDLGDKEVGGLYKLRPEQAKMGAPTHWMPYVLTSDVDAITQRAVKQGASNLSAPFDVYDFGRMSVIKDPTGAVLNLWQAKKHPGSAVTENETGFVCWSELMTNDLKTATQFYSELFNWKITSKSNGAHAYYEIFNQGKAIGGMMAIEAEWGPMPPHWGLYFAVDDCDGTAHRIAALGGKLVMPPMDIPGVGRFAVISDPQGGHFSVIQLSK